MRAAWAEPVAATPLPGAWGRDQASRPSVGQGRGRAKARGSPRDPAGARARRDFALPAARGSALFSEAKRLTPHAQALTRSAGAGPEDDLRDRCSAVTKPPHSHYQPSGFELVCLAARSSFARPVSETNSLQGPDRPDVDEPLRERSLGFRCTRGYGNESSLGVLAENSPQVVTGKPKQEAVEETSAVACLKGRHSTTYF